MVTWSSTMNVLCPDKMLSDAPILERERELTTLQSQKFPEKKQQKTVPNLISPEDSK